MANTNDTARLRSLYAAALFWDAIEAAAMVEATDGELPDIDWSEAEDNAIEAKRKLIKALAGSRRISQAKAERLVHSPNDLYHLEEHLPELEGIAASGVWAEITGRSA